MNLNFNRVGPSLANSKELDKKSSELPEDSIGSSDFKDELSKSLNLNKKNDDKASSKEKLEHKENKIELSRQEERNPSRGIKRKMDKNESESEELSSEEKKGRKKEVTENPQLIVSNLMASIENESETPDIENDLALIDGKSEISKELSFFTSTEVQGSPLLVDNQLSTDLAIDQMTLPSTEENHASSSMSISPEQNVQGLDLNTALKSESPVELQKDTQAQVQLEALLKREFNDFKTQQQMKGSETTSFTENLKQSTIEALAAPTVTDTLGERVVDQESGHESESFSKEGQSQNSMTFSGFEMNQKMDESKNITVEHSEQSFGLQADSAKTSASENVKAVQNLIHQAQFLATQGGGEVTVKIDSQHGLGEVELKVMMNQGVMNLELQTGDKHVQKLIQESLSDLKSSLAHQHIQLEHVKINNVLATNTDQQAQFSSQGQEKESQQSKAFEQFHQRQEQSNSNSNRQNNSSRWFDESKTLNTFIEKPMKSVQVASAKKFYGMNKGHGLNAVA